MDTNSPVQTPNGTNLDTSGTQPAVLTQNTGGGSTLTAASAYSPTAPITSDIMAPAPQTTFASPEYPAPYPVSQLTPSPYQPTSQEQKQSATSDKLQTVNTALSGKSAYENDLAQKAGLTFTTDENGNAVYGDPDLNDLNGKLAALKTQADAIPLQIQSNVAGRGVTAGGATPLQAAATRNNAIQALSVSALISAKQGSLATAKLYIDQAVEQKFGPIEAEQKALTDNLALIKNDPNTSIQDKQRADQQTQLLAQQAAQLDLQKQNYLNAQTQALKYATVATGDQLSQLQNATTPAQVAQIAASLGLSEPQSGRYKDSITTTTDAFGDSVQHVRIFDTVTGQFVDNAPTGATAATLNAQTTGGAASSAGSSTSASTTGKGLDFSQYGLLAKTDFSPTNQVDQLAQKYLDGYLKNGTVPTASTLGRGIKAGAFAQIDARARDLYFKATGAPLPNPEIIKGYQQQLTGNNKLLNNLNVQEGTIGKNAALLLKNLNANNLNQSAPAINGFIDGVANMLGDPNVATYLAQNVTVGNELGSLLSLKNAQGTTVHDKLEAAGLINKTDSAAQITAKVKVLLQEAVNAHDAINSANADLYKQIDPLMQDANNPGRAIYQSASTNPLQVVDPTGTVHTFKDQASADSFRKAAGL